MPDVVELRDFIFNEIDFPDDFRTLVKECNTIKNQLLDVNPTAGSYTLIDHIDYWCQMVDQLGELTRRLTDYSRDDRLNNFMTDENKRLIQDLVGFLKITEKGLLELCRQKNYPLDLLPGHGNTPILKVMADLIRYWTPPPPLIPVPPLIHPPARLIHPPARQRPGWLRILLFGALGVAGLALAAFAGGAVLSGALAAVAAGTFLGEAGCVALAVVAGAAGVLGGGGALVHAGALYEQQRALPENEQGLGVVQLPRP
jgi:hypothetical protein